MPLNLSTVGLLALLAQVAVAEEPPSCPAGTVLALDGLGTPSDDLARLAELTGAAPVTSQLIHRGGFQVRPLCAGAGAVGWTGRLAIEEPAKWSWVLLPVRLETVWNSQYPSGGNDGLLWSGRGFSAQARLGVAGQWGVVSAALAPELAWQQNDWFEIVSTGKGGDPAFQNPWYGNALDVPQRYGAGPFAAAGLGQSYLRVDVWGVGAGLSTENLWLGPGLRNSILLTNNAPGFPHLFLGTSKPVDIYIGSLEVLALWGQLERTRYVSAPRHPWYSALTLTYQPRWVPGLSLGVARSFVQSDAMFRRRHGMAIVAGLPGRILPQGNFPDDNQAVAASFRWVMPESRFEMYGEWGRDDAALNISQLVRAPIWTQGWVMGFQKLLGAGDRLVRVQAEATHLHDYIPNSSWSWYVHELGVDYTNAGQLLAAPAGPGGSSQFLAVEVLTAHGRMGGFLERTARNAQVFWTLVYPQPGRDSDQDVELAAGYRQVLFLGRAELSFELSAAYRWNRDFLRDEPNFRGVVQVAWPVGGGG